MKYVSDIIGIVGIAMIGYGIWLIHPPSSIITIGAILLAFAVLLAKNVSEMRNDNDP